MPGCIRAAIALNLLLMGIENAIPATHAVLPLGGHAIIQFGALMCMGIAAREIAALFRKCQSASKRDPGSACKRDPPGERGTPIGPPRERSDGGEAGGSAL